jgi:hypothetical protein
MPRYFFRLYNDMVVDDLEGAELPDDRAARDYAIRNIRDLMCESVGEGRLNLSHRIDVGDEAGAKLFSVSFGEAVRIEP